MPRLPDGLAFHSFVGTQGSAEHYISVEAPAELSLERQIDAVAQRYAEALQSLRLAPESAVFRRIFLSDAANQGGVMRNSSLVREPYGSDVAVSIVQQPPLPGSKIAMLAYHCDSPAGLAKRSIAPGQLVVERGELRHLWSTRICPGITDRPTSAADQTREVFGRLIDTLAGNGGTLLDNCVRTWIYIRDVDVFYEDLVAARTELFEQHGLTDRTHYIASTGIEGACSHRYDLVLMDAYSILGLRPEQVSYLNDFDRLCPTTDYNVTFERGTRIAYADRAHHFISGTASIDTQGQVVHVGDVRRQLDRTLDNVEALLRSGDAGLADMTHLLVYLRDATDYPHIAAALAERLPDLPQVIVRGAVCRPGWLVEVEGIAVAPHRGAGLPYF